MVRQIIRINESELESKCKERTLVLCKPESVITGMFPEILQRIQNLHYKTPLLKLFKFSEKSILDFYGQVIENLEPIEYATQIFMNMVNQPTLATVVEGPNSVRVIRKLTGGLPNYNLSDGEISFEGYRAKLQPMDAPMGTIRGDYSGADIEVSSTHLKNLPNFVHSSDSQESYLREIDVLLRNGHINEDDFVNYTRPEWKFLFGVDF